MNLLLDTHVFICVASGSRRMRPAVADALRDPGNALFLSTASVRGMAIRSAKETVFPGLDQLDAALQVIGLSVLSIANPHALAAGALPRIHGDAFDRRLVPRARIEGMTLVTEDLALARYGVPLLGRA